MAEEEIVVEQNPLIKMEEKIKAAQKKEEQPKTEIPKPEPAKEIPKEEPKAEIPKEQPKAEAPKEEPAKEEKKKSRKFWKKEQVAGEAKPESKTEPTVDFQKQLAERDAKIAAYEAQLNKPSVKHVLKAEESGKPFTEYYNEQLAQDPYKKSYTEIYEMQLNDQGLSKAEIDRKMEKFADLDDDDQLDRVSVFRKQLKEKFDNQINEYTPKYEQPEAPVDMWVELDPKYQAAGKGYEGKEILGITMTPERVNEVLNYYKNKNLIEVKDGMFDPNDLFEKTAFIMYREVALDAAYSAGAEDTRERLEEEYNVGKPLPSKNGSTEPSPKQIATDEQKRIANLKSSLPQN